MFFLQYLITLLCFVTGTEPQVLQASVCPDISVELLPSSVGTNGIPLSQPGAARSRLSHLLQVSVINGGQILKRK